ncbi:MAG: hypothetical protein R6X02_33795 [Enhygromyxa sp.]
MDTLKSSIAVATEPPSLLRGVERERLIAGLTCGGDHAYLTWLVEFLRDLGGVSYAFVGELVGENEDRVQTIALSTPAGPGENFSYDLADTPCATVLANTHACVHYPGAVAPQFPKDTMLVDMGIESYVGLGLLGASGRVNGLIVVLDTKPIPADRLGALEQLLQVFRARTEAALNTRRALRDRET